MSTEDVLAEHLSDRAHYCQACSSLDYDGEQVLWPCLPYKLAEALARTERQLAASVDELTEAQTENARLAARIVEADRVLFDCRKYVDSNVGPECYTYADEKPCNPCQVRHALGYGEEPWSPGDPKPPLRSE